MNNVTIITDPGIDDLIALMLQYKLFPHAKNFIVSTFGNASEDITSRNGKEFISFVAPSWQFMHGSALPLNGYIERPWPDYFHGPDGVWGVHPPIANTFIKSATEYSQHLDVISLGPMTDTLGILHKNISQRFTIMGGAFRIEGNETTYAETNIAFDADSAAEFFNNVHGVDVKIVPLDVTRKVWWTLEKVKSIPENSQSNRWLKKILSTWFNKYNHEREKHFNLHDPLAVYLHSYPEKAIWKESGVNVLTEGEERGRTVLDNTNPSCHIALDILDATEISDAIYRIIFEQ